MMAELTYNEKRLLAVLAEKKQVDAATLAAALNTTEDAVVQWAHLASDRGFVRLERTIEHTYDYSEEGRVYLKNGLPETQVFNSFDESIKFSTLQQHPSFTKIGFGQLRKKQKVDLKDGIVFKVSGASTQDEELALKKPVVGGIREKELVRRGILLETESVTHRVFITPQGAALVAQGLDLSEEVGTLTRDQILSGAWKSLSLRKYHVDKLPKVAYCGKIHPYQRLIDEMRQIFLKMGFSEIHGGIVQSSFWNFDALFQPQDHPAREMQDTFYLKEHMPLPDGWERVRDMHERGGGTSSTGWGGTWDVKKAEQSVLRTHTTALSIQHLAAHTQPPVKAFCIDRVYRREAIDPTHTPEFEQLEGIVMDEGVGFRHLLGFLKEFYARMGFLDVRFRPGYFPYTEPSVEPEVYVDGLGWVEMGGAGIFREEVTAPFGIEYPVLAWGLGVSRVAMLKLGLKDLRLLYRSDIDWIRQSPIHRAEDAGGRPA